MAIALIQNYYLIIWQMLKPRDHKKPHNTGFHGHTIILRNKRRFPSHAPNCTYHTKLYISLENFICSSKRIPFTLLKSYHMSFQINLRAEHIVNKIKYDPSNRLSHVRISKIIAMMFKPIAFHESISLTSDEKFLSHHILKSLIPDLLCECFLFAIKQGWLQLIALLIVKQVIIVYKCPLLLLDYVIKVCFRFIVQKIMK